MAGLNGVKLTFLNPTNANALSAHASYTLKLNPPVLISRRYLISNFGGNADQVEDGDKNCQMVSMMNVLVCYYIFIILFMFCYCR